MRAPIAIAGVVMGGFVGWGLLLLTRGSLEVGIAAATVLGFVLGWTCCHGRERGRER